MERLIDIKSYDHILAEYQETPIGLLLEYHNLNKEYDTYSEAQMLIGMCMDNRKHLHIPDNFSFILRAGGANLQHSEFKVSYAIAVGGVKYIAIIGHNNCGMVNLKSRKNIFIDGLVNIAGWNAEDAKKHFESSEPIFEIDNEIDFVISEAQRLRLSYPKVKVAPMFYNVNNNKLYLIREN